MRSICCKSLFIIVCLIVLSTIGNLACNKGPQKTRVIYQNDFENDDLTRITNGQITDYNNSKVIGRYNNSGFEIKLEQLQDHNLIQISFDLYIHDSWDGNVSGEVDVLGGPDIWKLNADGNTYINTTFSNADCQSVFCSPQSYPLDYLNSNNNPKKGAYMIGLPGGCSSSKGTTSLYKIEKIIKHSSKNIDIEFMDELKQTNSDNPLCDESWSVDNITIKAITF